MYKSCKSHYSSPSSWFLRYILAGQEGIAIPVLVKLAFDSSPVVRRHVAENPRTPCTLLVKLSQDSDCEVRLAVAENPMCSDGLRRMLAEDDSPDVRYALAENFTTGESILALLIQDDNPFVAWRALKTIANKTRQQGAQPDVICAA